MSNVIKLIDEAIDSALPQYRFLKWLLGAHEEKIIQGKSLVLFGTGNLGRDMLNTLKSYDINPICFCDSNPERVGNLFHGLPIISTEKLKTAYADSYILISSQTYAADIRKTLINLGFKRNKIIWPADFDMAAALFFTAPNQLTIQRDKNLDDWKQYIKKNQGKIQKVYDLFQDEKSRQVFIEKIATMANHDNIGAFINFLRRNSEPVNEFGLICFKPYGAENFYYFNNDIYQLEDDEIYVDIGAHDGDSIIEFVQACKNNKKNYKKIIAFEPDPSYFNKLSETTRKYRDIQCSDYGIWSEETFFKFTSSASGVVDGSAAINTHGDIEIKTTSLDKFLLGEKVTLIKMDPPGNIIPKALQGAIETIKKHKPKLVLGAYHSSEAIFEIPLLVHKIDPSYRLYLRHNSWGIGETDIYAI